MKSTVVKNVFSSALLPFTEQFFFFRIPILLRFWSDPANTRRCPDVGQTLCHRLRRWPSVCWGLTYIFNLNGICVKNQRLALSDSFEYLCYGSTTIINIFTLTVRGSTLVVRI